MTDLETRSRWFRFNLWLHRWSSLVATPMFLVLCLTGTVLIFHEEIDHAMGYGPKAVSADQPARPIIDSQNAVLAANPGQRVLSTGYDEHHPGTVYFLIASESETGFEKSRLLYTDLAKAAVIHDEQPDETTLTGFLFELHATWFLGPLGELVGALIALLVILSLISGLVVYAPYMKRIVFGVIRRGRGRGARLFQLDLHNFIGAVVLGWALLVSLTGLLLGSGTVLLGLWQLTELDAIKARYESSEKIDPLHLAVTPDQAFAATAQLAPGWRPSALYYPGTEYATARHYTVLLFGEKGIQERLFRIALVDAATGAVAEQRELPWYMKAVNLSQPLHFGDYGGLALKILWTVCTWLTLFITGNGAWLWWARRRRSKDVAA